MKALQKELNKYRFEDEDLNIKASIKDEDYYDFTPEHFDGFKLSHIKEFDDDFKENIKPKEVVEANINVLEDTGVDHFKLEGFDEDPFQFFTGLKIEPIKSHYLDGYYEHKLQGKTNKDIIEMRLLREGDAEINGYKGRDEDFEDFKLQYPELFGDPDLDISFESADSYSYGLDDLKTPTLRRASTSKKASTEDVNEFFERPEIEHSRKSDKASSSIPVEKATFQPKLARSLPPGMGGSNLASDFKDLEFGILGKLPNLDLSAPPKAESKAVEKASPELEEKPKRMKIAKRAKKVLSMAQTLADAVKEVADNAATKIQTKVRGKQARSKLGELRKQEVRNVLDSMVEDVETKLSPKEEPTQEQSKTKEAIKTYMQERGKKHKAATTIQKIARGKQSRDRVAKEISPRDIPNFEEQKPILPTKTTKQKTPSKPIESLGAVSPNKMARMIMAEAEKEGISLTEETLRELEQRKPATKVPKAVAKKEAKTEKEQRAEVVKANKQIANETAKRLLSDDSLRAPHSTSDLKEAFTQLNTFLKGKNPIDKLSSSDIAEYSKYTKFYKEPNKHLTVRTSYKRLYDLTHEIAQQIRENDEKDKIARQKRAQQAKASEGAGGAGVGSRL